MDKVRDLRAYASEYTPWSNPGDWMKWVGDDTPMSALSLPGTHDSIAYYGKAYDISGVTLGATRTQSLCGDISDDPTSGKRGCDLTQQLNAGIRFFDLRLACKKNADGSRYLKAYHGYVYQQTTYNTIEQTFEAWLDNHPSETVVALVANENAHNKDQNSKSYAPSDCNADQSRTTSQGNFRDVMGTYVAAKPNLYFRPTGTTLPTMGDMRHHVVLIGAHVAADKALQKGDQRFVFGDHYNVCNNLTTAKTCTGKYTNDNYDSTIGYSEKQKEIRAHLADAAALARQGKLRFTFSSATKGLTPQTLAAGPVLSNDRAKIDPDGLDKLVLDKLFKTSGSAGVVAMDFPGPATIDTIIAKNLPLRKPLSDLSVRGPLQQSFQDFHKYANPEVERLTKKAVEKYNDSHSKDRDDYDAGTALGVWTAFLDPLGPARSASNGANAKFEVAVGRNDGTRSAGSARTCPSLCAGWNGDKLTSLVFDYIDANSLLSANDASNVFNTYAGQLNDNPVASASKFWALAQGNQVASNWAVLAQKGGGWAASDRVRHVTKKHGKLTYDVMVFGPSTVTARISGDPFPNPGQIVAYHGIGSAALPNSLMKIVQTAGPQPPLGCQSGTATNSPGASDFTCYLIWPNPGDLTPRTFVAQYYNSAGHLLATSAPTTVTQDFVVSAAPNRTITVGDSTTFPLSVQSAPGRAIRGVTWKRTTAFGVTDLMAGLTLSQSYPDTRDDATYAPTITDQDGVATAGPASTLTVNDNGPVVLTQPQDINHTMAGCTTPVTFTARIAGGRGMTVKWQENRQSGTTWYDTPATTIDDNGDTSITLQPVDQHSEWTYRVVATDPSGTTISAPGTLRCP